MANLKGKTLFITGSSRGVGKAIALKAARDGANIAVVAETGDVHPKLPGTIYTAAEELEAAGGKALPLVADVRFEDQIQAAVDKTVEQFGGIDIVVNNASAIYLGDTLATPMKRFDLVHQIIVRGTFACTQACIPHLKKAENPHILTLSPPLKLEPAWFAAHLAYTIAKFGMSMCVLGWAEELKKDGIAANALWPRTIIATSVVKNLFGGEAAMKRARSPEILADAAYAIFNRNSRECTGNFFVDEELLASEGVTDLSKYGATDDLVPDLFL